jgi:putative SOS response-associated peptidase YedK
LRGYLIQRCRHVARATARALYWAVVVAESWDQTDSKWSGLGEDSFYSFAAITDDPEPEVAATGHDRTVINIKPEHVDAWLSPDPNNPDAIFAIFDDKRHPFL